MIFAVLGGIVLLLVVLGLWMGWERGAPAAEPARAIIVVDGSNVMHWGEGVPSVRVLGLVLQDLWERGLEPLVYFDANVGYKLSGRHMGVDDLAGLLPVVGRGQVAIVPSGTPADPYIIEEAIRFGGRVVTNDRYMDWREEYPAIRSKGFLVKGQVSGDKVALRF